MIPTIFLIVLFIGGASSALVKYAGSQIDPILLVALRSALAAVIVLPFLKRAELQALLKKPLIPTIAGILFAANWITFAFGIQRTSIVVGQLIYVPTSLIVAFFGFFLLKERLTKKQIIGLVFSITGIIFLIFQSYREQNILSFGTPIGNILIVLGLLTWSSYLLLTRKISNEYKPLTIIFTDFVVSGFASFLLVPFLVSQPINIIAIFSTQLVLSIIAIALVSSVLFFFLNQWLVKHASAFIASLILYPATLSAAIYGVVLFNEKFEPVLILGGLMILGGVFLSAFNPEKGKLWIYQ